MSEERCEKFCSWCQDKKLQFLIIKRPCLSSTIPYSCCVSLSKEITHAALCLIAFPLCLQRDDAHAVPRLKTCVFAASADTGSSGVLLSRGCNAEGRFLHIFHSWWLALLPHSKRVAGSIPSSNRPLVVSVWVSSSPSFDPAGRILKTHT